MEKLLNDIKLLKDSKWIVAQATRDLESMSLDEYINERFNKGLIGFNHPMFDKLRQKEQERDNYVVNPYEVEEGIIKCTKCGSNRVFSTSVQTRAADEPMTMIAQCSVCKYKWSQN
jgi:DNA-directed RNA polymerase subunit M/transcription elongation factor TFIIS